MPRAMICAGQTNVAALNKDILFNIDITPCSETALYVPFCAKITDYSDDLEEGSETYEYMCGDEEEINSVRYKYGISGHTYYGDPAQRFIIDMQGKKGIGRRTNAQILFPWGTMIEGSCTITEIKIMGGGPKDRMDFSFNVSFDEEGATTLIPNESIVLGTLPQPMFVESPDGVIHDLITWTFPYTTDEDKLKAPNPDLLQQKVNVVLTGGDVATADYIVTTNEVAGTMIYTFDLGVVGAWSFVAMITTGVVSNSMKAYDPANFALQLTTPAAKTTK